MGAGEGSWGGKGKGHGWGVGGGCQQQRDNKSAYITQFHNAVYSLVFLFSFFFFLFSSCFGWANA